MSGIPHHIMIAKSDRRLTGDDLRVYIAVQSWLSADEYLPIRVSMLAHDVYVSAHDPAPVVEWQARNVSKSMRRLTELGYLERGPSKQVKGARQPLKTYRLRLPISRGTTGTPTQAA